MGTLLKNNTVLFYSKQAPCLDINGQWYINSIDPSEGGTVGPRGAAGIDGSSVVDALVDDRGHLMLTMQDPKDDMPSDQVLALLNDGVITKDSYISMLNSINRLNSEVEKLSPIGYKMIVPVTGDTPTYETIYDKSGNGNCQIIVTDFSGRIRIVKDDVTYLSDVITDNTQLAFYNVLTLDELTHKVVISPVSSDKYLGTADITYKRMLLVEIDTEDNDAHEYPTFTIQGNHYSTSTGDFGTGGDSCDCEEIPDSVIDELLKDLDVDFPSGGGGTVRPPSSGGGSDCCCEPIEELSSEELEDILDDMDEEM